MGKKKSSKTGVTAKATAKAIAKATANTLQIHPEDAAAADAEREASEDKRSMQQDVSDMGSDSPYEQDTDAELSESEDNTDLGEPEIKTHSRPPVP